MLFHLTAFVVMYVVYVLVVFVGRLLYQKVIKKKLLGRGDIPREGETHTCTNIFRVRV